MSSRPMPWAPARWLSSRMASSTLTERPSIGGRHAVVEADHHLVRLAGHGRVGGVGVDVLDRGVPRVLQHAGLHRAAPEVLVHRVRRALGLVDRQPAILGELDGLVPGHAAVADRGDHLQLRGDRADADLEADLVVALAGAAVRDGVGAVLLRGQRQVLGDHRPRQRRDQRVALQVQGVGPQRRQAVLLGELRLEVQHHRLDGAAVQRALADVVHVLATLTDVGGHADHLRAGLGTDPADRHRGVQAAGIGEHYPLGHVETLPVDL